MSPAPLAGALVVGPGAGMTLTDIAAELDRCRRARHACEQAGDVDGWLAQTEALDRLLDAWNETAS